MTDKLHRQCTLLQCMRLTLAGVVVTGMTACGASDRHSSREAFEYRGDDVAISRGVLMVNNDGQHYFVGEAPAAGFGRDNKHYGRFGIWKLKSAEKVVSIPEGFRRWSEAGSSISADGQVIATVLLTGENAGMSDQDINEFVPNDSVAFVSRLHDGLEDKNRSIVITEERLRMRSVKINPSGIMVATAGVIPPGVRIYKLNWETDEGPSATLAHELTDTPLPIMQFEWDGDHHLIIAERPRDAGPGMFRRYSIANGAWSEVSGDALRKLIQVDAQRTPY